MPVCARTCRPTDVSSYRYVLVPMCSRTGMSLYLCVLDRKTDVSPYLCVPVPVCPRTDVSPHLCVRLPMCPVRVCSSTYVSSYRCVPYLFVPAPMCLRTYVSPTGSSMCPRNLFVPVLVSVLMCLRTYVSRTYVSSYLCVPYPCVIVPMCPRTYLSPTGRPCVPVTCLSPSLSPYRCVPDSIAEIIMCLCVRDRILQSERL